MVAYFYPAEERRLLPVYEVVAPWGLPVLKVGLPHRFSSRRRERMARRLYDRGLRRYLSAEGAGKFLPLVPVDPLPLCRAKGAELLLALMSQVEVRERRVALRGSQADPLAWALGGALCPRVGALLLDFDRGEEALSRHLRDRYGAVCLHLGQGPEPQAALELAPRPESLPRTIALWGRAELPGLTLGVAEGHLPPEYPRLPFLDLLWETGRVSLEGVLVGPEAE